MRKTKIVIMALLVLCLLVGMTAAMGNLRTFGASASTTQLSMSQPLTAQQVYAYLQSDPSVVMIDTRGNLEYTGVQDTPVSVGHIPGAYNLTDDGTADQLYRLPEKDRPYITYCNGIPCDHARSLAQIMSTSGYTNVTYMTDGVVDWASQGYTFETGQDPSLGGVIPPAPTSFPLKVITSSASVTSSSVQLNGNLTSLGTASSVTVSFQWGLSASYGNVTTAEAKSAVGTFTASLTGLTPATTYHFRAMAVWNGTVYGSDMTFITSDSITTPPEVMTDNANNIASSSAQLNGNLTSLGKASSVTISFQWGSTTSYGNVTTVEAKSATGAFTASLTGLTPATIYHFRAKAVGNGTAYGSDITFTTESATDSTAPAISEVRSSNVTDSSSIIKWTTNDAVTSEVEYGLTAEYGSSTAVDTNLVKSHSVKLTGLEVGTTYYYRAISKDASSKQVVSAIGTFTTNADSSGIPTWIWVIGGIGVVGAVVVLGVFLAIRMTH